MNVGGTQNEQGGTVVGPVVQAGAIRDVHIYADGSAHQQLVKQLEETQEGLAATRQQRDQFLNVLGALLKINVWLKDDRQRLRDERDVLRLQLEHANDRQAEILSDLYGTDRRVRELETQLTRTSHQLGQAHKRIEEANSLVHLLTDRARVLEARLRTDFPHPPNSDVSTGQDPDAIRVDKYGRALDSTEDALQSGAKRLAQLRKQFAEQPPDATDTVDAEVVAVRPAHRKILTGQTVGEPYLVLRRVMSTFGALILIGFAALGTYAGLTMPSLDYASGSRPTTEWSTCFTTYCTPVLLSYTWNVSGDSDVTTNFTTNRSDLRSLTGALSYDPNQCRAASVAWSVRADGRMLSSGSLTPDQRDAKLDIPLADNTQQITFTASRVQGDPGCHVAWRWPKVKTDNLIRPL